MSRKLTVRVTYYDKDNKVIGSDTDSTTVENAFLFGGNVKHTFSFSKHGPAPAANKTTYSTTGTWPKKEKTTTYSVKWGGWDPDSKTVWVGNNKEVSTTSKAKATWDQVPDTTTNSYYPHLFSWTFDYNDGETKSISDSKTINSPKSPCTYKVTKPKDPERTGYTFKCWTRSDGGTDNDFNLENNSSSGKSVTFKAKWEENPHYKFKLTYDMSDHGTAPDAQTTNDIYKTNYQFTVAKVPDKIEKSATEFWICDGWYLNRKTVWDGPLSYHYEYSTKIGEKTTVSAGSDAAYGSTVTKTLYAKWHLADRYTYRFYSGVGTIPLVKPYGDEYTTYVVDNFVEKKSSGENSDTMIIPSTNKPTRWDEDDQFKRYTFEGWYIYGYPDTLYQPGKSLKFTTQGEHHFIAKWKPTKKTWQLVINYNNDTSNAFTIDIASEYTDEKSNKAVEFKDYNYSINKGLSLCSKSYYHPLHEFDYPSEYNKWTYSLGTLGLLNTINHTTKVQVSNSEPKHVYVMWERDKYFKFNITYDGSKGKIVETHQPDEFSVTITDDYKSIFGNGNNTRTYCSDGWGNCAITYYSWENPISLKLPRVTMHENSEDIGKEDLDYEYVQDNWEYGSSKYEPESILKYTITEDPEKHTGYDDGSWTLETNWTEYLYHTCEFKPIHNSDQLYNEVSTGSTKFRLKWKRSGAIDSGYDFYVYKQVHMNPAGEYFLENGLSDYRPDMSTKTGLTTDRDLQFKGWMCGNETFDDNSDIAHVVRDRDSTDYKTFTAKWDIVKRTFQFTLLNGDKKGRVYTIDAQGKRVPTGEIVDLPIIASKDSSKANLGKSVTTKYISSNKPTDQVAHKFYFKDAYSKMYQGQWADTIEVVTNNSTDPIKKYESAWAWTGWANSVGGEPNKDSSASSDKRSANYYYKAERDVTNKTSQHGIIEGYEVFKATFEHGTGDVEIKFGSPGVQATNLPSTFLQSGVSTQWLKNIAISNTIPVATGSDAGKYKFNCWQQDTVLHGGKYGLKLSNLGGTTPDIDSKYIYAGNSVDSYNWDYDWNVNTYHLLLAQWYRMLSLNIGPSAAVYYDTTDISEFTSVKYPCDPCIETAYSSGIDNPIYTTSTDSWSTVFKVGVKATLVDAPSSATIRIAPKVRDGYIFKNWLITITHEDGSVDIHTLKPSSGSFTDEGNTKLTMYNMKWDYNSGRGTIDFKVGDTIETCAAGNVDIKCVCRFNLHMYALSFYNCIPSWENLVTPTSVIKAAQYNYPEWPAKNKNTLIGINKTAKDGDYSYTFKVTIDDPTSTRPKHIFAGWALTDDKPNKTNTGEPSGTLYHKGDNVTITIPVDQRGNYSKPFEKKMYAVWYAKVGATSNRYGTSGTIGNTNGAHQINWSYQQRRVEQTTNIYDGRIKIAAKSIVGWVPTTINLFNNDGTNLYEFLGTKPRYHSGTTLEDSYYYWEGDVKGSAKFIIGYKAALSYRVSAVATSGGSTQIVGSESGVKTAIVDPLGSTKIMAVANNGHMFDKWIGTYYNEAGEPCTSTITTAEYETPPAYSDQTWTAYFKVSKMYRHNMKIMKNDEGEWTWDERGGAPDDAEIDSIEERTMIKKIVYGDNDFKLTPWQEE